MNKGNVRLASEGQLDELRIAVEKAVNKLRGRIDATTAQGWIGNSEALDRWAEQLLPSQEANTPVVYLRPISPEEGIAIGPTSGTRTFANSANIFRGHLDAEVEDGSRVAFGDRLGAHDAPPLAAALALLVPEPRTLPPARSSARNDSANLSWSPSVICFERSSV